jgi:hypothetical protein
MTKAKTVADLGDTTAAGLAFVTAASAAAQTALLSEATTGAKGLLAALDKTKLTELWADTTSNPFAGPYPSWMYGIGGTGYYDRGLLENSRIFMRSGASNFANPFPYGDLDQAMGLTASVGGPARPGGLSGFTAPGQVSAYDEFGMCALLAQADSRPAMLTVAGTYDATGFVPTIPIVLSETAGAEIRLRKGMWIRTNDTPARFNGQITTWTVNGGGAVTRINVSGWFKTGGPGTTATPVGTYALINPLDKIFTHLNTTFLNRVAFNGTAASTTVITGVSSLVGLVENGQFVVGYDGGGNKVIDDDTVIIGIDYNNSIVYLSKAATYTGAVTLYATAGTRFQQMVSAEIDIFNNGVDFVEYLITDTGTAAIGSYTVTGITVISQWRPGLVVNGTGPALNYVTAVDASLNTITLRDPATVAGVVTLKAFNRLDENGTGMDMVGVGPKQSNTAYLNRGAFAFGYKSDGAGIASFVVQPGYGSALPQYGFLVDTALNGAPSVGVFTLMNRITNVTAWTVLSSGATFQAGLASAAEFQVLGTRVVNARKAGWTVPTGTLSRATYDTATVTTEQLAQRMAALLTDLHATAGHGLIGA